MHKISIVFALIFSLLSLNSTGQSTLAQAAGPTIKWEASFEVALNRARTEKKPILVDFWAPWCAPCRQLDEQVLKHPSVVAAARDWVCVKVDVSKRKDLYARYKLTGTPTLALLASDGQIKELKKGLLSPAEMVQKLRRGRN